MKTNIDQVALDAATKIMGITYGVVPPGGPMQIKAMIQRAVIDAIETCELPHMRAMKDAMLGGLGIVRTEYVAPGELASTQVPLGCTCGQPDAEGVMHRTSGPCFVNQPVEAAKGGEE